MTETNDLFEKLRNMIGKYGVIPSQTFYLNVVRNLKDYGKAEFERGHTEGNRAYKCGCLEIINENIELKDQNKELMRENVKLRGLVNDQSLWYDAEKCFPFFNKYVVLKVMRDDGTIGQVSNVSLQIRGAIQFRGVAQWIAEDNKGHESYIVGKVLKWRYADE